MTVASGAVLTIDPGVEVDVEVEVDVDVELARQFEHAVDLAGRVLIVARCAADQLARVSAIVLATARARGVPLPGTALVHQLLTALEARGRGEDGTQALLTIYEDLSNPR